MAADTTKPTLLGLSFSQVVNVSTGSSRGNMTATVHDTDSGVGRVSLRLDKELLQFSGFSLQWIGINADSMSRVNDGSISGSFSVDTYAAPGRYNILDATVCDNAGNASYYSASQVASMAGQAYILISDSLSSPTINDLIQGTAANDTFRGLDGADTISGLDGADVIYGNRGDDALYGNQGADTLFGGQGIDAAFGGQGDDVVYGNMGDDALYGGVGDDTLFGGQGDDIIEGGDGNDVIFGNRGNDILKGGTGADRFVFGRDQGRDLIVDFNAAEGDRIDLGGSTYGVTTSAFGEAQINYAGGTITLANTVPSQVNPSWFA